MQEKKTLFVGQIVAQFDLVSTTSRLRASQNLLVPSLLRTQSQRKGLWEGRKNQVSSAWRLCLWHSRENNEVGKETLSLALGICEFH